jgi:hypothetical protein
MRNGTNKFRAARADEAGVKATFLEARLGALRAAQNPDGGWGYYASKGSWLEPTVLAALALHGDPVTDRAWALTSGWQQESGAWRPAASVDTANWSTSMAVVWAGVRGQTEARERGQNWLKDQSEEVGGWPWKKVGAAVEPTAWASVALPHLLKRNIEFILQADVSPDNCGPALLALQGSQEGRGLVEMAQYWAAEAASPMTRAWIRLGLRVNGVEVADPENSEVPKNLMVVALEALAAREGNHGLLQVSGVSR